METNNGKNTNTLLIIFGVVGIAIALFEVMINMHSVDESDRPIQIQQIQAPQTSITSSSDTVQDTAVSKTNIRKRQHHAGRAARRRRASRATSARSRGTRRSSVRTSRSSVGTSRSSVSGSPGRTSSDSSAVSSSLAPTDLAGPAPSSNLTRVVNDCHCEIDVTGERGSVKSCFCHI